MKIGLVNVNELIDFLSLKNPVLNYLDFMSSRVHLILYCKSFSYKMPCIREYQFVWYQNTNILGDTSDENVTDTNDTEQLTPIILSPSKLQILKRLNLHKFWPMDIRSFPHFQSAISLIISTDLLSLKCFARSPFIT